MSELNVLTWLWSQPGGRSEFTVDHVAIWASMISRNLTIPHRISCVTDFEGLPSHIHRIEPPREFEHVRIPSWPEFRPQCLRRITMYAPDAAETFGERFACMDLDCVVTGNLDEMLGCREDFRIAKGTAPERPYNGSLQLLRAGARAQVYRQFTPEKAAEAGKRFLGSDQAWISHCLGPKEVVWAERDGLGWFGLSPPPDMRVMFYPGSTKPWQSVDPLVAEHYRGDREGRCLVLGYGANLWADVSREIEQPFEAVIASPEAAQHWPGKLLAVAHSDREAVRLARMYGFKTLSFCGMEH